MEEIMCPICGNASGDIVWVESGFSARRCPCELVYVSPRPTQEEVAKLYRDDEAFISASAHIEDVFYKQLHAKFTLSIIRKYIRTGTLLEIGAGAGYFADQARSAGFKVLVIEPNKELREHLEQKLGLLVASSLQDLISKGFTQKINVIYHCDVLSHFPDPVKEFNLYNRLLEPNGYLIFETGNVGELSQKWFSFIGKLGMPDHLFFFSPKSIEQICSLTSFSLIDFQKFSIVPYIIYQRMMEPVRKWAMFFSIRKLVKGVQPTQSVNEINYDPEILIFHGEDQNKVNNPEINLSSKSLVASIRKFITQNLYIYFLYFFRYRIGRFINFFHGPQTTIYFLKKA